MVEVEVGVDVGVGLANKIPLHADEKNIAIIRRIVFVVVRFIE